MSGTGTSPEAGGIGGAALWDPPNQWQESHWTQLAMMPAFLRVFGLRSGTARAILETMERKRPEEPHWVSGRDRQRSGGARPRLRTGADAITAGPLRRQVLPGLPRVEQAQKCAVLNSVLASV